MKICLVPVTLGRLDCTIKKVRKVWTQYPMGDCSVFRKMLFWKPWEQGRGMTFDGEANLALPRHWFSLDLTWGGGEAWLGSNHSRMCDSGILKSLPLYGHNRYMYSGSRNYSSSLPWIWTPWWDLSQERLRERENWLLSLPFHCPHPLPPTCHWQGPHLVLCLLSPGGGRQSGLL